MTNTDISNVRTIETYEPRLMPDEEYRQLVERIRFLYEWFAPGSTDKEIWERLHHHPETHIDLIVIGKKTVGFSIYHTEEIDGRRVMYRGGTVIHQDYWSLGLYKPPMMRSIRTHKPVVLVTRTQNPRVYVSLRSFSPNAQMYPAPDGGEIPEWARNVAMHFCKNAEFDHGTFVVRGCYKGVRKDPHSKKVNDPVVKEYFGRMLGENDGFLVIVPLERV